MRDIGVAGEIGQRRMLGGEEAAILEMSIHEGEQTGRDAFGPARLVGEVELGDQPGIGSSFKIVNQLLAGVHIAAACEAITFAKSLDLDISRVFEVISRSAGNSWMFENRIPHVLAGDYTPHSAVSIFTKDLGIVSDIGRKQKFPLPIASAALQLFIMTEAAGMGHDDDSSVARLLAKIAGLDLPGTDEEN